MVYFVLTCRKNSTIPASPFPLSCNEINNFLPYFFLCTPIINTWCGYKITRLMLEHFLLKKLHNRNAVTLNIPPLQSLHHSIWIFQCWKQCCRSSSDSLCMSSIAFAFTASTDSNMVPLNTDLICGNKKSHMELGQVSMVDVPTRWSCVSSKTSWQTGRCVPARCLGEELMSCSSTFQVLFFSPVQEGLSKPPCSRPG